MTKIISADLRPDENGENYVFIEIEKDGNIITKKERYFNDDGSVNEKAQEQYIKACTIIDKQKIADGVEQMAQGMAAEAEKEEKEPEIEAPTPVVNSTIDENTPITGSYDARPQTDVVRTTVAPEIPGVNNLEVNQEVVNNPKKKRKVLKTVLALAGLGLAGFLIATGLKSCGDEKEVEEPVATTEVDEISLAVDNQVVNLTVDDVKKQAYEVGKYLNDEMGLNISQQSINSTVFVMNQENGIDAEETKQLIDSGFIADDPSDVFPATLETTATINNYNAKTIENSGNQVISYSIFSADKKTQELSDAFANDIKENQQASAVLNSSTATKEEKEAAKQTIIGNWTSYLQYGGIKEGKTELPFTINQGTVASEWVGVQQLAPYSVAAGKAGVSQKEIDFASGIGKNSSVAFVDFSTMYNLTSKNLADAYSIESAVFDQCEPGTKGTR